MNRKDKITAATSLMKENRIKKLCLLSFGTYSQYELAGEKCSMSLLDRDLEDYDEEWVDKMMSLLSFLEDTRYIYTTLGFPETGQNDLFLDDEGNFTYETFRI